jgi:hypothetical protein
VVVAAPTAVTPVFGVDVSFYGSKLVSASTSNFVSDDGGDGVKVYVEHGDFGSETMRFIHTIARDVWFEPFDEEASATAERDRRNPTLRYWKSRKHPSRPDLHMTKRRFYFTPPPSECLLGSEDQYNEKGFLKTHPACRCTRCVHYYRTSEWRSGRNFWAGVTGAVKVNV